ncbi:MAG: lipopolysaccharide biosynthesis protein, partial [Fibrobacterota bacterium]
MMITTEDSGPDKKESVPVESLANVLRSESRDTALYALATVIVQAGAFILLPLCWRRLTPHDYGIIAVVEVIGAFLSVLVGFSLDSAITRFYNEWNEQERPGKVGSVWIAGWLASLVLSALAMLILSRWINVVFREVSFFPNVFIGIIGMTFVGLSNIPSAVIRMRRSPKLFMGTRILQFSLSATFTITLVVVLNKGVFGYFLASALANGLMVLYYTGCLFRWTRPCYNKPALVESLHFSLPQIPAALLSSASAILDRTLLQRFVSLDVLGIYSLAMKFAALISVLHYTLKLSFVPFVCRSVAKDGPGKALITQMTKYYIFVLFLGGTVISLFIGPFVAIINRPAYFPVVGIVPPLVAVVLFNSLYAYYCLGFFLSKRTGLQVIPAVIQLFCIVGLGFTLVQYFAMPGMILAKALASIVFSAVSIFISIRIYKITYD